VTTITDRVSDAPAPEPDDDRPRVIRSSRSPGDHAFRWGTTGIGAVVLLITGAIGVFLGYQMIPTLREYGLHFFTENQWDPEQNIVGISAVLVGTVEVAVIAIFFSFPLALLLALYVSEYAPWRIRGFLASMVDLMAAVPSIIYGLWGYFLIDPHALYIARFLNEYFGWFPLFHVEGGNPRAPVFTPYVYGQSAFIAGLVVSMMIIPIACAVMVGVFRQTPPGEREGAFALGSTRWGMVRTVVLPFGRGGIVGGMMLALGRALGETIAVVMILSLNTDIKLRPLEIGGVTTAQLIANFFGEATSGTQLSALLAAGFVLFIITLIVNTIAGMIVSRSRSGAETEI
jgi:phosphate transport system permease protein